MRSFFPAHGGEAAATTSSGDRSPAGLYGGHDESRLATGKGCIITTTTEFSPSTSDPNQKLDSAQPSDPNLKPEKKPTRQWDAWTRQEEENFFNALRQVGKNFEKITHRVQNKNKDQIKVDFDMGQQERASKVVPLYTGLLRANFEVCTVLVQNQYRQCFGCAKIKILCRGFNTCKHIDFPVMLTYKLSGTQVPASVYLGFCASIIWVGQGTYLTSAALSHARDNNFPEG